MRSHLAYARGQGADQRYAEGNYRKPQCGHAGRRLCRLLQDAIGEGEQSAPQKIEKDSAEPKAQHRKAWPSWLPNLRRMFAYTRREALELKRDPIRATLAILGSVILMFVIGYGINLDVEKLTFAVLDRDDTTISREYTQQIAGSRYFIEKPPITDYDDLDRRMREGEISLAIEIPPNFAANVMRGRQVEVAAWIDGAMPTRAETAKGYVQGVHANWLTQKARALYGDAATAGNFNLEIRYRYNPDVQSLVAMVPAVIPLLLLMIPAMLAVLSVVREKELGSIINFYVTPVTKFEFLLGKQLPYIGLAFLNFLMLTAFAVFIFRVPFTGSFVTYATAALLYVIITTSMGLVISTFMNSQIAAIFGTALMTLIPAVQYSGIIDPVSALQGVGAFIGKIYPTTYFVTISRGTFSKALDFSALAGSFLPLLIAIPVLMLLGIVLLKNRRAEMRIANIFRLGIKELRGLMRDPMLLILIVYAFTLAIYTAAKAMPETLNNAAIAIVDEDQSPVSGRITTAFYPPYFVPPKLISSYEMDNRMDEGLDTFALNIPPDFQRDLLAGRAPTIQLNVDATRMSQAFTGGGYVQSIVAGR